MLMRILVCSCVLLCSVNLSFAQTDPLATLRKGHPRLLVLDDQLQSAKKLIATDRQAADLFASLKHQGEIMIDEPTAQNVLVGPRLLNQSHHALEIISTTAGLYRLTGDLRFADRARKEVLAVAAFPSWNPSHFLDVAEMTNACGIGYDWMYDRLTDADRATIRTAIIEKGINPAFTAYEKHEFWTNCDFNWAQVCAGGLTVGALAIADEEPDLSRKMIDLATQTIRRPMQKYAPDGGWEEGPGYWNYGTSYNVFFLAAAQTALDTDFGLDQTKGFADAGNFEIDCCGPIRKVFNFSDAGDNVSVSPQMFWLARQFNQPDFAAWERAENAGHMTMFHLLWFNPAGNWPPSATRPLDAFYKRINTAFMRSGWDSKAWFIGLKGGDNGVNHSHLDLGTFVLDALGQRWATDLGPDNYNLPGYFGKQRFTYYRLGTPAHNTLSFNGQNQPIKAKAPILQFSSTPNLTTAIVDLTHAYPGVKSVRRGFAFIHRNQLLIQDEVETPESGFEWNLHTPAKVEIQGNHAALSQNGQSLQLILLSPADAAFTSNQDQPPKPQAQNPDITNVVVKCGGSTRIAVLFSQMNDAPRPKLTDLNQWGAQH